MSVKSTVSQFRLHQVAGSIQSIRVYDPDGREMTQVPWEERARVNADKFGDPGWLFLVPGYPRRVGLARARKLLGLEAKVLYRAGETSSRQGVLCPLPNLVVRQIALPEGERKENCSAFIQAMKEELSGEEINAAIVRGGKITLVTSRVSGWMPEALDREVLATGPVAKRFSADTRLFRIRGRVPTLDVGYLEGEESLYDGLFYLSERLFLRLLDEQQVREEATLARQLKELPVGETRKRARLTRRLQGLCGYYGWLASQRIHNARVVCIDGQVKGNCLILPNEQMKGHDVLTHRCNLKREHRSRSGFAYVGLEPQPGLPSVRTDVQSIINLPFMKDLLGGLIESAVAEAYHRISSGEYTTSMAELAAMKALRRRQGGEGDDQTELVVSEGDLDRTLKIRSWTECGMDYRISPWLVATAWAGLTNPLLDKGKGRLCLPIPGGRDEQIISTSAARVAAGDIQVADDFLHEEPHWGFGVVSDATWKQMIELLGGCDMDDHFVRVPVTCQRTGQHYWMVYRRPNMMGEYILLRRTGQPKSFRLYGWDSSGHMTYSEEVGYLIDLDALPPQVGQADVLFTGMPEPEKKDRATTYSKEYVLHQLEEELRLVSPGGWVNSLMLFTEITGKLPDIMLDTMEGVVDNCTKEGAELAWEAIRFDSSRMLEEAVQHLQSTGKAVDQTLWRRVSEMRLPGGKELPPVKTEAGWLTTALSQVEREIQRVWKIRLEPEAQQWAQMPEALRAFGSYSKMAADVIRAFRRASVESRQAYDQLRQELVSRKNSLRPWEFAVQMRELNQLQSKAAEDLMATAVKSSRAKGVKDEDFLATVYLTRTSQISGSKVSDALGFSKEIWEEFLDILYIYRTRR